MKTAILLFSLLILPVAATTANAEERQQHREGPCQNDVKRLCGQVEPGDGRIAKCIKEHENEVSAECRQRIDAVKQKISEAKDACKDDVEKFCKGVQPGQGNIVRCLKEHEASLSEKCRGVHERRVRNTHDHAHAP